MRSESDSVKGSDSEERTGHRDPGSDQLTPRWKKIEAGVSGGVCPLFIPVLNQLDRMIKHLVKKELKNGSKN